MFENARPAGRRWQAAAFAVAAALATATAHAADTEDHPLVTRYPGSEVTDKKVDDFDRFALIVGLAAPGSQDFATRDVEGRFTQIRYQNPKDRSETEIFANYEQALAGAGFAELWRCADEECGPTFAASRWTRFNGTINIGRDGRYLVGSLRTAEGEAFVALAVNKTMHQLTIVEVQAMEAGLVTVDPEALGNELDTLGHVAIPGVFFETGKATLTPESAAALEAMATILAERAQLKVWVVGHTDWTGGFELNMRLSDARAKAVVAALVERYGVEAARLEGHGVGPLSPDAANTGETGRTANRRVELVARPD